MGGLLSSRKRDIQGVYRAVLADRLVEAAAVDPGQRLGYNCHKPSPRAYEDFYACRFLQDFQTDRSRFGHAESIRRLSLIGFDRLRLTALAQASWNRGGGCATYLARRPPFGKWRVRERLESRTS